MKYFLDTEFLEGPQKERFPISLFRKNTPPTIDLISIGIVAEDGREYYAISKDFNLEEAWNRSDGKKLEKGSYVWIGGIVDGEVIWQPNEEGFYTIEKDIYWIRENVLKPIWIDLFLNYEAEHTFLKGIAYDLFEQELKAGTHDKLFTFKSFQALVNRYGKTNKHIAQEIELFCHCELHLAKRKGGLDFTKEEATPEFYAYFADYDWVVFCWLFGKMMDLPEGFPMYCRDLKQILEEKPLEFKVFSTFNDGKYIGSCDPYYAKWEDHVDFPKQDPSKSHNAIEDARWNKQLFDFLNTI